MVVQSVVACPETQNFIQLSDYKELVLVLLLSHEEHAYKTRTFSCWTYPTLSLIIFDFIYLLFLVFFSFTQICNYC